MGTSNKTGEKRKEKGTNKTYMYQTMINDPYYLVWFVHVNIN